VSLALEEHRQYLSDQLRTSLFRKAIGEVVRPGDVVMDLGAGSGILGLLACQAGARRVYAVDAGGVIQVACEFARANGFGDRFVGIQGFSTRIALPEKVDVIIADQVGHFGFEAGLFEYFRDAAPRFLKAAGKTIPESVTLRTAAVSYPAGWKQIQFWSTHPAGFDFSPALEFASNTAYPTDGHALKLISTGAELITLDAVGAPQTFTAKATVRVARAASMHGIGGWFSSRLSPAVTMTNNPAAARRIDRRCVFMPIEHPVGVVAGDRVHVGINVTPEQSMLTWKVKIVDRSGHEKARSTRSSLRGMLMTADAIARTHPEYQPRLTPWGQARRTVIDACNGRHSLAQIECLVFERHRNLFDSVERAAQFVAKVTAEDAASVRATTSGGPQLQQTR
jgi:hypothetical protein